MQETVASALAQLARLDPAAARSAESALASLTAGQSLEQLTQRAVQDFCWYVLPVRFSAESQDRLFVARSLGRLFSLLDLPRYAAVCTSEATRGVLAAHALGHSAGVAAYARRMHASGIEPPDLTELTWGTALGSAEIEAYQATSAALELAVAAGDVRPEAPGWRAAREQQARVFLTQPDGHGRSRLDRVREERVRAWLAAPSHPHRQRLWPLLGQIIAGAEPPPGAARALAPVQRLLDYAHDGIQLTQIGYVSPTVVRELCAEFGWSTTPSPPRSETDVMQLIALHKLLRSMRAVRRSGRRLVLTRRGRQLHAGTEALWRAVAESVLRTDGFEQAAAETLFGLLLLRSPRSGSHRRDDGEGDGIDIAEEARLVLTDAGWEHDGTGEEPGTQQVRSVLITVTWLLETLGCVLDPGLLGEGRSQRLTKVGRAFALTAIHLSATTPRASI
ncbi:hypothetical protein [Marinitenerispora sediminis]|uniref:Uncharacterized protein n=1 Tax=Marinitenerispora sediminis TaxID=1931232 RepID=A0A368T5U0_9ACTN|nr:hypothetical protein [Marinitenerispora sediminis]RCV48327.1 hypothetical protein DEF23_25175 [Marinitenerispora sediminis]RCV52243.1 hypothetical protein DEF28_13385 [Marinitenerispora sediminis]RCV59051.1 hypothetical protein DEF24_11330 [Marinitenerispora sediminis]